MKCSYCQQAIIRNLTVKELLFPFLLESGELCPLCQKMFQPIKAGCEKCQKEGITGVCHECKRWQKLYPSYDFHQEAIFKYNDGFAEWIEQYKYLGHFELRKTFAPRVKKLLKHDSNAIVCPIPLSEKRQQTRGFNQVEAILSEADIAYECLLKRELDTTAQAKKTREERLLMPQPFEVNVDKNKIMNQEIILVDDVYTTGRTMFYAAECLLPYQPKKIRTFTLAR
ncbi:ComF family protein [Enterococcus cecorum]|uniref:ComF family protein n=2 Tax=Enterococcus cecorum TaxID=44008 RepID=UPI00148C22E4|nr:ComF family protein [Enterococcus cecorum]MCJ0521346.1 ComF family protein [Enterococcus cecorum]MCJ0559713.1 ComF family protein [Enterococcus cecorum]MCJ0598280.1 ComF family protein [Enterococcus cecorum]